MSKETFSKPVMARATARGYMGKVIEIGEVFEVPAGTEKKSNWFTVIESSKSDDDKKEDKAADKKDEKSDASKDDKKDQNPNNKK